MNPDSAADEVSLQRDYYARTAELYEGMHISPRDPHHFAMQLLMASLDHFAIGSVLDIGSGTGRAISYMKKRRPGIKVVGIEPVEELRRIGYRHGLSEQDLVAGNALEIEFEDNAFDLCCEFGVLHHIRTPEKAVEEMLRVGKKGIFLSDANNFGQGSAISRFIKQLINALHLWKAADYVKTGGKGYTISEGDGLAYSYSVFNNYRQIEKSCRIHLMNTCDAGVNLYRTADHVALLGIKREWS